MTTIEQAIEKHRALNDAWTASFEGSNEDCSNALDTTMEALDELAATPCKSEAEFRVKMKYLFDAYREVWGEDWQAGDPSAIMEAIKLHFAI